MKKIYKYVVLLLFVGVVTINAKEIENYSKMSTNELEKALKTAVTSNNQSAVQQLLQAGANPHQALTYTVDDYDCDWTVHGTVLEPIPKLIPVSRHKKRLRFEEQQYNSQLFCSSE